MLAFVMDAADGVAQVWVTAVGSGSPVQITSADVPAARPRWSPRGDQILFERQAQGIWSVPALGGTSHRIVEQGASPNFSADGATIVFERGPNQAPTATRWGLWLANADGTNVRMVEGVPDKPIWAQRTFPALSPDGQWIAFFRQSAGPTGDLWVARTAGGGARQLTRDEREGGAPSWTSDSQAIIFPSQRRGSRTLWQVSLSGEAEPVTTGAGADDEPDLSRDGARLVYTNRRDRAALTISDPSNGARTTIVEGPSIQWLPQVSPDGGRIAFFTDVEGDMHLFTMKINGQDLRQLTFGRGQENIHPSWAPDGTSLYYYNRTFAPERVAASWRRFGVHGEAGALVVDGWKWATHNNAHIDPTGSTSFTRASAPTPATTHTTPLISATCRREPIARLMPHICTWPSGHRILPASPASVTTARWRSARRRPEDAARSRREHCRSGAPTAAMCTFSVASPPRARRCGASTCRATARRRSVNSARCIRYPRPSA